MEENTNKTFNFEEAKAYINDSYEKMQEYFEKVLPIKPNLVDYTSVAGEIHISTSGIKEKGNDLISIAKEMYEVIDVMFEKIYKLNVVDGAWTGDAATEFIKYAKNEKVGFTSYIQEIYDQGKYLVDYADAMEAKIAEVRI